MSLSYTTPRVGRTPAGRVNTIRPASTTHTAPASAQVCVRPPGALRCCSSLHARAVRWIIVDRK
jgi:hypothetical protein